MNKWADTHPPGEHDVAEFTHCVMEWLGSDTNCAVFYWEQRLTTRLGKVERLDMHSPLMPITLKVPANCGTTDLQTLLEHWATEDGYQRGICVGTDSVDLICIQLERYYKLNGKLKLNRCPIDMPDPILVPFFPTDANELSWRTYTYSSFTLYTGNGTTGHYRSYLALDPMPNGARPGLMKDDNRKTVLRYQELLPMAEQVNLIWLCTCACAEKSPAATYERMHIEPATPYAAMQALLR